jgi:hypothetical protein
LERERNIEGEWVGGERDGVEGEKEMDGERKRGREEGREGERERGHRERYFVLKRTCVHFFS